MMAWKLGVEAGEVEGDLVIDIVRSLGDGKRIDPLAQIKTVFNRTLEAMEKNVFVACPL